MSTPEQRVEIQMDELREYCMRRDWYIVAEIQDVGFSGSSDSRPGLKRVLELVRRREVDVVVVVKMDRLFRSLKHIVNSIHEFSDLKVEFVAVRENIDCTTAAGKMMLHLVAAFAEFELSLMRERVMASLDHARRNGKVLGRPQKHDPKKILELRSKGLSYRAICRELNAPMAVIGRAIKSALKTEHNLDLPERGKTVAYEFKKRSSRGGP